MRLSGRCLPSALSLSEVWLVVLAAIFLTCSSGECNEFCRTDFDAPAAECDSDVFLGSILSVHAGNDSRCEEIISKQLHVAVAMHWAVDRLNTKGGPSNVSFVPGVKLGVRLMDDCGLEVKAAGHVVNLLESQGLRCPSNASSANARSTLAAVLAASASNTTRLAARLLATHNVSLISVSSSLAELYNKSLHYNVINTLPSEAEEDQAILSLMLRLRWTYVIGMYFDDAMRRTRYTAFKASAAEAGVCVAYDFPLVTYSAAHFRESLSDAIKLIFFLMDKDTPEDQIAVVFFSTARMARFIFQIVTADQTTMNNWRWIHRMHFVFPSSVGVDEQLLRNAAPYNSRIFVVSPASVTAPASFRQYLVSVLNSGNSSLTRERYGTWVQEYMTLQHGCTSGRQDCQVSVDDVTKTGYLSPYVKSAIDGVCYAASVVRTAHAQLCAGPGMCPALRRLLNDRNSLLSRFTASPHLDYNGFETDHSMDWPEGRLLENDGGDLVKKGPLYEIYHRHASRFVKIGEYSKNNLSLDENIRNTVPLSVCKSICPRCLQTRSMPHVVLSGDVYILGFFTLHERGPPWDRFTCGHFRVDGGNFPSFFAFLNAIQELQRQSQVKFGAIAVDDCNDPVRASLVLDNILSGRKPILDPVTGDVINASRIVAALGPESSSTGLALLPVLMESQIPVVFPFASSTDFDDSVNYPYVLRAVPKNQLQINAIAQAVDVLNVSFIGVLYSDDNQGIRSLELLQEWARAANVCVSPPQAVSEEATGEELIVALRQATERGSRLVVVLSSPATARHIMDLQPQRNLRQIIFLAGYRWGLRRDLLEGTRGEAARGALIFALDSSQRPLLGASLPAFLASLSSSTATPGSLLEAFFQAAFRCNKVTGFVKPFDRNCADDLKLTTEQIQMFVEDERVMQTQIAVASLAKGYEEVWQKKGCHALRNPCTRLDPNDVTAAVTSAKVKDIAGGTFQPFTSDRTGSHDLSLYNVKQVNNPESTFTFAKVGHYDVRRGNLTFDRRDVTVYNEYGAVVPLPEISCHFRRGCAQQCRDKVLAPPVLLSTPSPPDPQGPAHASISPHALNLVKADIEIAGVTLAVCIMTLALVAYGTFLVRKVYFLVKDIRIPTAHSASEDHDLTQLYSRRNPYPCTRSLNGLAFGFENRAFLAEPLRPGEGNPEISMSHFPSNRPLPPAPTPASLGSPSTASHSGQSGSSHSQSDSTRKSELAASTPSPPVHTDPARQTAATTSPSVKFDPSALLWVQSAPGFLPIRDGQFVDSQGGFGRDNSSNMGNSCSPPSGSDTSRKSAAGTEEPVAIQHVGSVTTPADQERLRMLIQSNPFCADPRQGLDTQSSAPSNQAVVPPSRESVPALAGDVPIHNPYLHPVFNTPDPVLLQYLSFSCHFLLDYGVNMDRYFDEFGKEYPASKSRLMEHFRLAQDAYPRSRLQRTDGDKTTAGTSQELSGAFVDQVSSGGSELFRGASSIEDSQVAAGQYRTLAEVNRKMSNAALHARPEPEVPQGLSPTDTAPDFQRRQQGLLQSFIQGNYDLRLEYQRQMNDLTHPRDALASSAGGSSPQQNAGGHLHRGERQRHPEQPTLQQQHRQQEQPQQQGEQQHQLHQQQQQRRPSEQTWEQFL